MRRFLLMTAALLLPLISVAGVDAEPQEKTSGYLPSPLLFGLLCSAKEHPLVPQGTDPEDILYDPVGWALSGEPECAYSEALNAAREAQGQDRIDWGFGHAAFPYTTDDEGTLAIARADDAVFGVDAGYLRLYTSGFSGEEVTAEGCGLQSFVLPRPPYHPSYPDHPGFWLVSIREVGVDEDLDVCFSTTGFIHGTWGA